MIVACCCLPACRPPARPGPACPPAAAKYESAAKLLQLVRHAESDAWLALGLAFYLSVLPLTRQLVSAIEQGAVQCVREECRGMPCCCCVVLEVRLLSASPHPPPDAPPTASP